MSGPELVSSISVVSSSVKYVIVPAILILVSSPRVVIECTGIHRAVQRTYSSCTLLVRTGSTRTPPLPPPPGVLPAMIPRRRGSCHRIRPGRRQFLTPRCSYYAHAGVTAAVDTQVAGGRVWLRPSEHALVALPAAVARAPWSIWGDRAAWFGPIYYRVYSLSGCFESTMSTQRTLLVAIDKV
eukprot:COSAG01_NODE_4946_length_4600_cov_9.134192_1_plen_183_part_00